MSETMGIKKCIKAKALAELSTSEAVVKDLYTPTDV